MRSATAWWRALVAALVAGALLGCTGIPVDGEVTAVRPVAGPGERGDFDRSTDDGPVFRRFPPPLPGATPEQVLRGFLDAHADLEPDQRVARQYLDPATVWDPRAGVTVFSGERDVNVTPIGAGQLTATVAVRRVATVTAGGEFVPRSDPSPTLLRFALRVVAGEWRLFDVPSGLVVPDSGLERAFRRTVLYFPDPDLRRLVPDVVFLRRTAGDDLSGVASALLSGPTAWLRPAVRTAVPTDVALSRPVTLADGVATVDVSREVHNAPQPSRSALMAQLVWTLTEPGLGVTGVRVLVDGREMARPDGRTDEVQTRSDWSRFDPSPSGGVGRLLFLRDTRVHALDGEETSLVRYDPAALREIAVTRSGAVLAAVRRNSDGNESLLLGGLGSDLQTRLVAPRLTSPTWEAGGDRVWVLRHTAGRRDLVVVPVAEVPGGAKTVRVDTRGGQVESVLLAPDGVRAALVVRHGATRSPWVARVEQRADGVALAGLRPIAAGSGDTFGVSWEDGQRLIVAGSGGMFAVDVDGYAPSEISIVGLPARPVRVVTGGPGDDDVVEIDGRIWRRSGGWRLVGPGTSPVYAG